MNKKKIQQLVQHISDHWLRYFLISLAVIVVISAVVVAITPTPPEEQPVNLPEAGVDIVERPSAMRIVVQNIDLELPKTLPVYFSAADAINPLSLAEKIANNKSIPKDPSPYLRNVWTNSETSQQIIFQDHSGKIIYTAYGNEELPSTNEPFNIENAVRTAESFISSLSMFDGLSVNNEKISYIQDEHSAETGGEAQIIIIPFSYKIDSYPTYYTSSRTEYVTVQVSKDYQVVKAEFFPPPPPHQEVGQKNLISLEDAAERIELGAGTIIAAGSRTGELNVDELSQLTIETALLEYRYLPTQSAFIPYFRFVGTGEDLDGVQIELTIILPAINTTPAQTNN